MTGCAHGRINVTTIQTVTEAYWPDAQEWADDQSAFTDEIHALVSAVCTRCGADMLEWAKREFPTLLVKEATE